MYLVKVRYNVEWPPKKLQGEEPAAIQPFLSGSGQGDWLTG